MRLIEKKDFMETQDILHDEYLYLRETTLISKDETVQFKKRFKDGLTLEKLELINEVKDLLAQRVLSAFMIQKKQIAYKNDQRKF